MNHMNVSSSLQIKLSALLAGMFFLSLTAAALADDGGKPCAADVAKLCKDTEKGKGNIAKCLREHKDEVSGACKDRIGKMKEKAKDMKEACKGDAEKLCKGIKPGDGKFMECMKRHEGELSQGCKDNMGHGKGHDMDHDMNHGKDHK